MNNAQYARLYADESGESHFEDLAIDLVPVDFAPPAGSVLLAEDTWGKGQSTHVTDKEGFLIFGVTLAEG